MVALVLKVDRNIDMLTSWLMSAPGEINLKNGRIAGALYSIPNRHPAKGEPAR
jgi:hypothetical protein